MEEKEFQIACAALDDSRKVIAAGKVQRWDVVKWGVSVNLALATVSVPIGRNWLFAILSIFVLVASLALVLHYNNRMTGARTSAIDITERLKKFKIDYKSIAGADPVQAYSKGCAYDLQELILFILVLVLSMLPTVAYNLFGIWPK